VGVDEGGHNGSGGIPILEGVRSIVGIFIRFEGINWGVEEGDFPVVAENGVPMEMEGNNVLIHIRRCGNHGGEDLLNKIIGQV
jgi:hypothetical protein